MQRDRFLLGILIGIGVLIVAALILFFVRNESQEYVDDSTPQGALRNYFLAVHQGDYERAYGYIMESAQKPDFDQFQKHFTQYNAEEVNRTVVEIGEVLSGAQTERVSFRVYVIRPATSLLGDSSRSARTVVLVQQDGQWKLEEAPYPFWVYR